MRRRDKGDKNYFDKFGINLKLKTFIRSIKQCLDRNPNAFKPKIGKNTVEGERR